EIARRLEENSDKIKERSPVRVVEVSARKNRNTVGEHEDRTVGWLSETGARWLEEERKAARVELVGSGTFQVEHIRALNAAAGLRMHSQPAEQSPAAFQ